MKLQTTDATVELHPEIEQQLRLWGLAAPVVEVRAEFDPYLLAAIQTYEADHEQQAVYLAEEIYLAHFQGRGQLAAGLKQLFTTFAKAHFPADGPKQRLLNKLLQDMATATQADARLTRLTTWLGQQTRFASQPGQRGQTLADFKRAAHPSKATAFGDLVMLPAQQPYVVIGDSHGDANTTQRIIDAIQNQPSTTRPYVIFMGDYVHNGLKSIDNLLTILSFKQQHPERVILLSGNHDYRETFQTALNEYFNKHWPAATRNPHPGKQPPHHYGHLRLDAIREFGPELGERLSRAIEDWGYSLPYLCLAPDGTLISHSIGQAQAIGAQGRLLAWPDLLSAKSDDLLAMQQWGISEWNKQRASQHSAMVNNRPLTAALLDEFGRLGLKRFIVGHTHYRSGDRLFNDRLITVCSSHPDSPDAGHYIFQEMGQNRAQHRLVEGLPPGEATACYLWVRPSASGPPQIEIRPVV